VHSHSPCPRGSAMLPSIGPNLSNAVPCEPRFCLSLSRPHLPGSSRSTQLMHVQKSVAATALLDGCRKRFGSSRRNSEGTTAFCGGTDEDVCGAAEDTHSHWTGHEERKGFHAALQAAFRWRSVRALSRCNFPGACHLSVGLLDPFYMHQCNVFHLF
jgi:hypothetical protein